MTLDRSHHNGLYRSERSITELGDALERGAIPISVYGLGKMGLPIASVFAERTGNVTGVDIDPAVVASVNDGISHVSGEPGLPETVERTVESGSLTATTDGEAAAERAVVHVIIVPTLVDDGGTPDLSTLESAVETITSGVEPGDLVVVESTVPPGACRDVVAPRVREATGDTRSVGVAVCPERTASGSALEDIRGSYPKIVGGIDDASTRAARAVYETVTDNDVVTVSNATTAACVKVFEGVYRDVNIALANELAGLADEFDVSVLEAIEAANTQPFCDLHTPGAGVGGHCIPVYPHFLIEGSEMQTPLLSQARAVNEEMPNVLVDRLADGLDRQSRPLDGASVAILGVTYRPGVDEIRNSPAIQLAAQLRARGATVFAADPVCTSMDAVAAQPVETDELPDLDLDALVLVTAHEPFTKLDLSSFDPLVIVDGRQELSDSESKHLVYSVGEGFTSGSSVESP